MADITNPHDLLFRQMLSTRETAQDFLRNYLPEVVLACLDLESLEITRDSFVDPELRLHVSDLVYRANLAEGDQAYLYVLFEHKSQPDPLVALQLLRYMTRLWDQVLRQTHKLPLPPVIPLVFYHGHSRWTASPEFAPLLRCPTALEPYTPRFRYALVDLSHESPEEVRGHVILRAMLLALRHTFDHDLAERIPWILALLAPVVATRTGIEALEALLRYFSTVGASVGEEALRDAVKQVLPEEGERIMATLAEKWIKQGIEQGVEQGVQQGVQQGIEQGIQRGSAATAQELLLELLDTRFGGVEATLRERIRGTGDVTVLKSLFKTAATAESVAEFRAALETHQTGP